MMRRLRFLLCEDGREYLERFERFLGERFDFIQSRDYATLLTHLEQYQPIAGVLLDLDFRRTETSRLVDVGGRPVSHLGREDLSRLVANQGIAILANLRREGWRTAVFLFADIADLQQREYLVERYPPVELIDSHVGLNELQLRFEALGIRTSPTVP